MAINTDLVNCLKGHNLLVTYFFGVCWTSHN